jgi:hypothetical protein
VGYSQLQNLVEIDESGWGRGKAMMKGLESRLRVSHDARASSVRSIRLIIKLSCRPFSPYAG